MSKMDLKNVLMENKKLKAKIEALEEQVETLQGIITDLNSDWDRYGMELDPWYRPVRSYEEKLSEL